MKFYTVIPEVMGGLVAAGATSMSLVADEVGPLGDSGNWVFERGHHKFIKADGSDFAAGKYVILKTATKRPTPFSGILTVHLFNGTNKKPARGA